MVHYRGRELKRGKMWFQIGEPRTEGFVKYFYTGLQRVVLPATADVERAPELAAVVKKYNELVEADGFPAANHVIMTHYIDGEHSIGMHYASCPRFEPASQYHVVAGHTRLCARLAGQVSVDQGKLADHGGQDGRARAAIPP